MGRKPTSDKVADDTSAPAETKVRVAPEVRKQATLLFEISGLYRTAGSALKAGDDLAYERAYGLIEKYQDLFNTLAKAHTESLTAEGLAAAAEM